MAGDWGPGVARPRRGRPARGCRGARRFRRSWGEPGPGRAGDRAARLGTQGAGAGLHSGPVSSTVPEAPGLTHPTARRQIQAPHHVRHPTQRTRTAPHPVSPRARPPGLGRRRAWGSLPHAGTSARSPHALRSRHPKPALTRGPAALTQFPSAHPPLTLAPPVHPRAPLPAAAPRGAGGVAAAAPFPGRVNKRLLLPARPKKGRLSGVRGGRGGPTLRPCPTWRPWAAQAPGQRGAAPRRQSHPARNLGEGRSPAPPSLPQENRSPSLYSRLSLALPPGASAAPLRSRPNFRPRLPSAPLLLPSPGSPSLRFPLHCPLYLLGLPLAVVPFTRRPPCSPSLHPLLCPPGPPPRCPSVSTQL